ncbi:MAG: hypothetical protein DMG32_24055 [Acidobacteria bacterium]|nr:MAG: hypothetical protein DMG32_24055 [Acidobacteriota bacterium]
MNQTVANCIAAALILSSCLFARAHSQGGSAARPGGPSEAVFKQAAEMPTPRAADGHPDLTGFWTDGGPDLGTILAPNPTTVSADGKVTQLGFDSERALCERGVESFKRRTADPLARPSYKLEYQARVADNFKRQQYLDPAFRCQPVGVPRQGPPKEIAQTPTTLYFFYRPLENNNSFRVIPIDGRPHKKDADGMADGDSVGRWDGDTLVVDVTNLSEDTWLDTDGDIHSSAMRVVERLTRKGNTLRYEVTVEDPVMLTKPWSPRPRTVLLGKPGEHIEQNYPCSERSTPHLANEDRH